MNRPDASPSRPRPIDLAQEADFSLGGLDVSPSLRRVATQTWQETLEPRIMQVLIVLARANGAVVSRDVLIERCWGGRIVGDDAITRCIGKIRQVAQRAGPSGFEIETVPRVGYRLTLAHSGRICAPKGAPSARRAPRAIALAVVAVLLVCAGAALLLRPRSAGVWVVDRSSVPIATDLIEAFPAISPDGAMIAFSAGPDILSRKIYLQRVSGGEPLKVSDDNFDDVSPSWSPDGSQLAYVQVGENAPCRLMVMPAPTGPAHELTRCKNDARSQLKWSASGKDILFLDSADSRGVDRVMRFNIESGQTTALTHPLAVGDGSGDTDLSVSPNGRWISFVRGHNDLGAQRLLLNLQTLKEHVLIDRDIADNGADWSEDSRDLFVDTALGGEFALWTYPIDGGAPTRILSDSTEMGRISTGPRGLMAIDIQAANSSLAWGQSVANQPPRYLAPDKGSDLTPDVSPNGTIAFVRQRPSGDGLWLTPPGGEARKLLDLTPEDAFDSEPRWSPDGTRLAFGATAGGMPAIRVVTASGANIATITLGGAALHTPAWSPDGKALLFPAHGDKAWQIWRVDLARPDKPTPLPYFGWRDIRSRGQELYGVRFNGPGVWRIDGVPRRITALPPAEFANQWTVTNDDIAYVQDPQGKDSKVFDQPIHSGPPRLLARVPRYFAWNGFAVDQTGAVLYTAASRVDRDIQLLHVVRR